MTKAIAKQIAALEAKLKKLPTEASYDKKIDTLQDKREKLEQELSGLEDSINELEELRDNDSDKDDILCELQHLGTHVPKTGAFTCYKQCRNSANTKSILVTLKVPAKALRVVAKNEAEFKCRVSEAKVVSMVLLDGYEVTKKHVKTAYSHYDVTFKYTVGKTVTPREEFDTDTSVACLSGIHVFMEKHQAILY